MSVVLSQIAPWNDRLTNAYRTRYAQVGDRFYEVKAESLYGAWYVTRVDFDGEPVVTVEGTRANGYAFEFALIASARNLAEARALIAADTENVR